MSFKGPHKVMVTSLGHCVNWPLMNSYGVLLTQKALVVEAGTELQPKRQKVRRRSRKRKSGAENGADHVDNSAAS